MNSILRKFGVVLAGSALVFGIVGVPAASAQVPAIKWTPCPEDAAVDCGTLRLPVDWAKPGGEQFDMAVARRKASGSRIGTLVVHPGGPGYSGVRFTRDATEFFSPEITQRFDIVGFDQRGNARSRPVRCPILEPQPTTYPVNQAEFDQLKAYNVKLRTECRKETGAMYDHVSTPNVVRDIEALRLALGERKISYWGTGYGTMAGQQYAERHGDKLRAMVIDSSMDHSVSTGQFLADVSRTLRNLVDEFAKWCAGNECALRGQDVGKVVDDLMARADRGELRDPNRPGSPKLSAGDVQFELLGAFYGGRFERLAATLRSWQTGVPLPMTAAEVVNYPVPAMYCSDFDFRVREFAEFRTLLDMEIRISPHTRGAVLMNGMVGLCQGMPKPDNPQRPLKIRNAPKILMLSGRHDPGAPYEWVLRVHEQTKDTTVLVTYDGVGHGVYGRTACTRTINDRYLVDLKLPRNDTHCAAG